MEKKQSKNPKKTWNEDKEKEYFEQLKEFYREQKQEEDFDKKEVNGVFIPRKLLNSDSNRSCPVCSVYTTKAQDDLYFTKFDCCFKCYIQWVEGREERWKSGWIMKLTTKMIKHIIREEMEAKKINLYQ